MSIFKTALLSQNIALIPANFFHHHKLLQQLLQVAPRVSFFSEEADGFAMISAGSAAFDRNRVRINIARSLLEDADGLSETLAHEMRHIWQRANSKKSFPLGWCRKKAEWAKYLPYPEDQAFLLEVMGVPDETDADFIGYLMSWEEVDARAYAAWFMYEREQGIPFVEPQSDIDMLTAVMRKNGIHEVEDLTDLQIFMAFLDRMFLAEARIQRAYVRAGLYDKARAEAQAK